VTVVDAAVCGTLGCEKATVEDGYCAECADISPGILDSDGGNGNEAPEEGHRASDVSSGHDEPESGATESPDSGSDSPVGDRSGNTNSGFETGEPAANDHPEHEQGHAVVATPQHVLDDCKQKGRPR
jgi:hypothetical protein